MKLLNLLSLSLIVLTQSVALSSNLPNFGEVADGIYRSARPEVQDRNEVLRLQIHTILNLEASIWSPTPQPVIDEKKWAESKGIGFVHFPMSPVSRPTKEQVLKGMSYLANGETHPILIHCYYGSDRTGIVVAAYRIKMQNWSVDQAYQEMIDFGHNTTLYSDWREILEEIARD